jgi:hypothetical protein
MHHITLGGQAERFAKPKTLLLDQTATAADYKGVSIASEQQNDRILHFRRH